MNEKNSLRISLDVTAVPNRPAGAGRYTVDLARRLDQRQDAELVLIARGNDSQRWSSWCPRATVEAVSPTARPMRLLWEQTSMPRLLEKTDVDVHHGPHYTMPEGSNLARVVTIHDLTVFDHPEWHQRSKVVVFRRAIKVAAKEADVLVCVSESTATLLRERCSPTGEIRVVHHGVDHLRFTPNEPEADFDDRILSALAVRPPYVLFVGTIEPRKDVPTLLKAFDLFSRAHGSLSLVLAGGKGWGDGEVAKAISEMQRPERVRFLGYVPDDAIPALLRNSSAVAYPSLAEGFGLPVLEALACGAPVVTTSGSAMEEVAAGSALIVPTGDFRALAGALDMLVRGDVSLEYRRARGIKVASDHTWAKAAQGHMDAYLSAFRKKSAVACPRE